MDDHRKKNASPSHKDGEGVRVTEHGRQHSRSALFYKALAVVLVGCCAAYLLKTYRASSETVAADPDTQATDGNDIAATGAGSYQTTAMPDRKLTARPAEARRDPNDLSNYISPGQPVPKVEEVIDRLHKAGIYSGIGAFSPPGTSPPLVGLSVPEGFELPEGYVRHFQATDDGQRIEPILMYSPDFEFFDASGNPIAIPPNRVVPPGQAPPGLPIRLIEIPPPLDPPSP
jgi:hypothetical protein